MGSRDFAGREKKKPKKDAKKQQPLISTNIQQPRPEVEVIRKGKKPKDFEEEE